jgi:hypothetical protein
MPDRTSLPISLSVHPRSFSVIKTFGNIFDVCPKKNSILHKNISVFSHAGITVMAIT